MSTTKKTTHTPRKRRRRVNAEFIPNPPDTEYVGWVYFDRVLISPMVPFSVVNFFTGGMCTHGTDHLGHKHWTNWTIPGTLSPPFRFKYVTFYSYVEDPTVKLTGTWTLWKGHKIFGELPSNVPHSFPDINGETIGITLTLPKEIVSPTSIVVEARLTGTLERRSE